jgi:hypothetical protein
MTEDPAYFDALKRARFLEKEARELLEEAGETVVDLIRVTPNYILYTRPKGVATAWRHDRVRRLKGNVEEAYTVLHIEAGMPAEESYWIEEAS